MTQAYRELVIGGVLVAPIVSYAVATIASVVMLRTVCILSDFPASSAIRRLRSSVSTSRSSGCWRCYCKERVGNVCFRGHSIDA